jgi:hypothetical protein
MFPVKISVVVLLLHFKKTIHLQRMCCCHGLPLYSWTHALDIDNVVPLISLRKISLVLKQKSVSLSQFGLIWLTACSDSA